MRIRFVVVTICISIAVRAEHPASNANEIGEPIDELPKLVWTSVGNHPQPKIQAHINGANSAVFEPGDTYKAAIGAEIQRDNAYVSFNLGGAAADNVDAGTVLSIDGASIGYVIDRQPGRPGSVRMVASTITSEGTKKWVPLNVIVSSRPGFAIKMGVPTSLRFHHATRRYDVFIHNTLIQANLSLPSVPDAQPSIVLATGCSENPVTLTALTVGDTPKDVKIFPVDADGHVIRSRSGKS